MQTDTDFDYLLAQARIESSLNPKAKAPTSSAAGLYQFISQTWLSTLNQHGEAHGYGWASEAIAVTDGRAAITDPSLRQQIMQLRFDPMASSLMAGELAQDNAAHLQSSLGRPADHTELYLAHFLGVKGAERFIKAHETRPADPAANLFPEAARANPSIFYTDGRPSSLAEMRGLITAKLDRAGSPAPLHRQSDQIDGPEKAFALARSAHNSSPARDLTQPSITASAHFPAPQTSMAEILRETFGASRTQTNDSTTPPHVAKAYRSFARFGL